MGRPVKATPEQVQYIRDTNDKTLKELAAELGLSLNTVFKIKHGQGAYKDVVV